MLASNNFVKVTMIFDDKEIELEFDLRRASEGSFIAFGNVYVPDRQEPLEFTFFTINNKIAGYTPMNGKKEFISAIVSTVLGQILPFEGE